MIGDYLGPLENDSGGDDFLLTATKFFINRGYHPYHAAGIAGNLMHESGGRPDILHDKGAGYGLAGWNGDRRQNLYRFAGTDKPSIEQQLEFVDYELKNHETKAYEALQKTTSPEQAAKVFSDLYERPGKPMMNSRIAHARKAITNISMKNAKGLMADASHKTTSLMPGEYLGPLEDDALGVVGEYLGPIDTGEMSQPGGGFLSGIGKAFKENTDMGALAEPNLVGAAGEMVGKAIDMPFVPLRKGLEITHRNLIEPVRQHDITSQSGGEIPAPGLAAPEAFAPLAEEKAFTPTMEFALSPAYFKLIGRAGKILNKYGKDAFYKYAPDWMFSQGEAGLPEVLSQERITEILSGMTGEQRAAMAQKYPDFREVLMEWQTGAIKPEMAAVAGELTEPQLKLPGGQGFEIRPKTILRKTDYPGQYLAVSDVLEGPPVGHASLAELGIQKPVRQANDILSPSQIILKHGGFDPKSSILKNFEPEEVARLKPFMRKGAQSADELLEELKTGYPEIFGKYDTSDDLLRDMIGGGLRKEKTIPATLADEVEFYKNQEINELMQAHEDRLFKLAERKAIQDENAIKSGIAPPPDADIEYFFAGLPLPNIGKMLKNLGIDVSDKDMGVLKQLIDLPYWIAQDRPGFANIFNRQRLRVMERTIAINTFMDELEPHIKHLKSMPRDRFERLNKAAFHFDRIRKEPDAIDFANYALHKEDLDAYFKVRELLDYIREDFIYLMQEMGAPKNLIDEIRREMGKIPGYIPHRRQGRYYVGAKMPEAEQAAHYEMYDDLIATMTKGKISPKGKKIKERLEKDYPEADIFYGKLKELPEDYFWHVDTKNMQAIMDAAVDKLGLGAGAGESLKLSLINAAAETFKARGFGSHGIKRKDIPGYEETDFMKSAIEFINGYFGFKTKMRAAGDFQKGLSALPPKSSDRLYSERYVRDMLQNSTILDRTVDKARGLMFYHYIAFAARQLLIQPTQNFVAGVANLQKYTKWSSAKLLSEMGKSMADLVRPGGKAARLTADELAGLEMARNKGIVSDLLTQEYMGYMADKFGRAGIKFNNAAGFFIGRAEKFNRETMYITAYRVARNELKKNHFESMAFAEEMVDKTHFVYGKSNLPQFFRGSDASKLARTAYTFRTFNHNLLRLYWDLGKNQGVEGQKAIMKGLASMLVLGGLTSIPFYKDIEKFYQQKTGKNIRTEIKKNMGDYADYINYGMPNLIGVDLSGSMSIEALEKPEDILGVPASMTKQVLRAKESIKKGDYLRAAEDVAPSVLRGPISAYRVGTEGMTTRSGKKITDSEGKQIGYTSYEIGLKSLGFRPTKTAEMQRQFEAQKTAKEYWGDRRQTLIDSYRSMINRYGATSRESQDVLKEIIQFNKDLADQRIQYISPIKRTTLIEKKEPKRTRALKKEFE